MGRENDVLAALLDAPDGVSGEMLAEQLGISRNGVWKAVQKLRKAGYAVDGATNRGYRLRQTGDRLTEPLLRAQPGLADWDLLVLDRVDSTNTYAKQLALRGFARRTAILADAQTGGRGRLGRRFVSPPGSGLYMSLLFRPRGGTADAVRGTTFAAVAAVRAIARFCETPAQIKWVNDLYMNGKKICGILTEAGTSLETGELDYMVIGIGINVRHTEFPPELREIAGTIEDLSGAVIPRAALAAAILEELGDPETGFGRDYMDEYRARSMILGCPVSVLAGDSPYDAVAVEIDDDAALIVEADGVRRRIAAGEVSIRKGREPC